MLFIVGVLRVQATSGPETGGPKAVANSLARGQLTGGFVGDALCAVWLVGWLDS